jgi:hypothetical protein
MKNELLKYNINRDEYLEKYSTLYSSFFNVLLYKKYSKVFCESYVEKLIKKYDANYMINLYIKETDKDYLYKWYTDDNMYYMCIGKLQMINKKNQTYGNYYIVLKFKFNQALTKGKIVNFQEFLTIDEYVNRYKQAENMHEII